MGTTPEAFPPLRLIIEAGITTLQSGLGPRRLASRCLDRLRNAKMTSSTWTIAWMMTRRRASGERPAQAFCGVFDLLWLMVQFYHSKDEVNPADWCRAFTGSAEARWPCICLLPAE